MNPDPPDRPTSGERQRIGGAAPDDDSDATLHRLDSILRALPESELHSLIQRMGIRVDAGKRIDAPSQAARALVGNPDIRDLTRLSAASRELLHRIADANGVLYVPSLPAGLDMLIARGVVFGRRTEGGTIELVLPAAYLLQLKAWESEDPRGMRALLSQAPFETLSAIASHYLGRPATPPIALSLEHAWETLSDPPRLAEELEKLPPGERRLLEAIESVGGEVETQELLDLEREPMRLRGAGGVTATRRGAGFSLERRAFLVPIHPNRHVVPTEVARIVGADRRELREIRRAEIRSFVLEEDHAPRRARFAPDPAALAVAIAFAVREPSTSGSRGGGRSDSQGIEVRAGVGTPRSLIARLAQRFGREVEATALVAALSRSLGLWDPSASSAATPPGSYALQELTRLLFSTWRRGGAWDEARNDREVLRVAAESRDASPIGALREMVLEALHDLGEGRWVPWTALRGYLAADQRLPGVERLVRRWAERAVVEAPEISEVVRRVALETLPALGIVDLGSPDGAEDEISLRLTPRGRGLLGGAKPTPDPSASKFLDGQALRVGPTARVANVLALASFAELGRVAEHLDLILTPQSLARALSLGLESDALRARIEALTPLPDSLSRLLAQASEVLGKGSFVGCAGFLWVDDPEIRELLRTRRQTADLFVDPSPPAGLLVAPDVDSDKLVRRCRGLGVEVEIEGGAARVSRATPVPSDTRGVPVRRTTRNR
jgi:hypothetical protein